MMERNMFVQDATMFIRVEKQLQLMKNFVKVVVVKLKNYPTVRNVMYKIVNVKNVLILHFSILRITGLNKNCP